MGVEFVGILYFGTIGCLYLGMRTFAVSLLTVGGYQSQTLESVSLQPATSRLTYLGMDSSLAHSRLGSFKGFFSNSRGKAQGLVFHIPSRHFGDSVFFGAILRAVSWLKEREPPAN